MLKRIFLFAAVNILVMITITTVLSILGVNHYITAYGIDYTSLMIFCLAWGMGGAFIFLALSRIMAKWMMGVKIVDPNTPGELGELVRAVHHLARAAKLPAMPEVGVYESPEINAFATGPSKSRSLVAVSSGILRKMNRNELEGVLAHEVAHIANGDMVTMTLIQGIVNAFVMFLSRVIAFAISQAVASRDSDESDSGSYNPMVNFIVTIVLEILFSILGSIVVSYFSRQREYRADAGGAIFAGRENMINALRSLKRSTDFIDNSHSEMATLKISGKTSSFLALFSTHPNLDDRIERLSKA